MPSASSIDARREQRWRWALGAALLWRLLFPFFDSPLSHLFSDPARHWSNAAHFLDPELIGAGDPYLYQVWLYLVRNVSGDDPPAVMLSCGFLCALMPYGWYRALRELLPRRPALAGALVIALTPDLFGIYAYFMNETLFLTLSGFAFWCTFRAWRKGGLAAWTVASSVWVCLIFTRTIAVPMAAVSLFVVWVAQPQRFEKALIGAAVFCAVAIPAGLHGYAKLGYFAPLGNLHITEIYLVSGKKDIELNIGPAGRYVFGSPSFYNPTFYPFSPWLTDREGTVSVTIDLHHGSADWVAETLRAARESTFSRWQQAWENVLYAVFGQSWPDNDMNSWSGRLAVWTRWIWPPMMLYVAWGVWRRRFHGRAWLLPALSLGMLFYLMVQHSGIVEGRYVKPLHPILLAAALVLYLG